MATKKNFSNPAEGLIGVVEKNKEDIAITVRKETNTPDISKSPETLPVETIIVHEKEKMVPEKNLNYQLKYSLSTSLRMNRIVDKLKENDPENAGKYSKKYFIDQAIEKALISYEKKLGI